MDINQEDQPTNISRKTPPESDPSKTNRNVSAETPTSLDVESDRDPPPAADDAVVKATNVETPPLVDN